MSDSTAATFPDPHTVRRDQCNGRTLACANCNRLRGDTHHILCYAYALARQEADMRGRVYDSEVQDLHFPDEDGRCGGDDFGGYEAESPNWPCRTALLLYTEEEINEVLDAMRWAKKWRRENEPRFAPSMMSRVLGRLYSRMLSDQLQPLIRLDRFSRLP